MCIPAVAVIQGIGLAASAISAVNSANQEYNQIKTNARYQTQAALVNMKNARNAAYNEIQQGIDESRKEKIEKIQKSKYLIASAAAGGFSIDSDTNQNNINDLLDLAEINSKEIQKKYQYRANNYLQNANNYLNEANRIKIEEQQKTKNKLYSIALNGLGQTTSVAQRWYKNGSSV